MALLVFFLTSAFSVSATDYTSTNFILRDPVLAGAGGVTATSASFQYFSSTAQITPGESSGTTIREIASFLYFSVATAPSLSGTAGDAQASLTWTASVASLGATVASYAVGQSTVAGGPYTYTNVGNVLASTRTGLTNGTTYRFAVQARDADGQALALSNEVSLTPVAAGGGGGDGAGGVGYDAPAASLTLSGRAYPNSEVFIIKDAQLATSTFAGPNSLFTVTISNTSAGNHYFGVYAEDAAGRRSSLLTFPVSITQGTGTNVNGIFLSPTLAVDKTQVKLGDTISIFGQSTPYAEITIEVDSDRSLFERTTSDALGAYLNKFDTSILEKGDYSTRSKAVLNDQEISPYSLTADFAVGDMSILATTGCGRADLNCDRRVDLVDFSIAAFWYQKGLSSGFAVIERERLNGDGKIDLVDFSIMAYYWTG